MHSRVLKPCLPFLPIKSCSSSKLSLVVLSLYNPTFKSECLQEQPYEDQSRIFKVQHKISVTPQTHRFGLFPDIRCSPISKLARKLPLGERAGTQKHATGLVAAATQELLFGSKWIVAYAHLWPLIY